jgi:tRNA threonylcarbamoyladenosine biosynthesis protein TsaB
VSEVASLLLALDTSTSTASVALHDGARVLSETTWLAGREHSTRLLVEIEAALERVGQATSDLTGLVVARGPGSFTGVRVALSVAKGMAAGLGIPCWGVSSLDILAAVGSGSELPLRAVLEAGRGRFATALYLQEQIQDPPRLMTVEQLMGSIDQATCVIGDLTPDLRGALREHPHARLAPPAACLRRAGFLAELGAQLARRGESGDPAALDALYVSN